jgi:MoxR-like ATPase
VSIEGVTDKLRTVIRGSESPIELLTAAVVSGGHVLLEDLPGTGKTTLVRALATLLSAGTPPAVFHRIQCTPDLLPYDVTGVDIYDPAHRRFTFRPGPVFSHLLLVDEINRATPKVQSALLEVMNEKQVTVGGQRYGLAEFFMVIATENPVGMEGTYPLPLAELDRFTMRLRLGYPDEETERSILTDDPSRTVLPSLQPEMSLEEVITLRRQAEQTYCHPEIVAAVTTIARKTREHPEIRYGVSPRGGLHLLATVRALARIRGRDYVSDIDLEDTVLPVLAHRLRGSELSSYVAATLTTIRDEELTALRTRRAEGMVS